MIQMIMAAISCLQHLLYALALVSQKAVLLHLFHLDDHILHLSAVPRRYPIDSHKCKFRHLYHPSPHHCNHQLPHPHLQSDYQLCPFLPLLLKTHLAQPSPVLHLQPPQSQLHNQRQHHITALRRLMRKPTHARRTVIAPLLQWLLHHMFLHQWFRPSAKAGNITTTSHSPLQRHIHRTMSVMYAAHATKLSLAHPVYEFTRTAILVKSPSDAHMPGAERHSACAVTWNAMSEVAIVDGRWQQR